MGHCFSHLTKADRFRIEALLKAKQTPRTIADILHVHISTVYREIKRARTVFRNSDWTEEERYNPDLAHARYLENLAAKGGQIKLADDYEFADYIEHKIIDEHNKIHYYRAASFARRYYTKIKPRLTVNHGF